MTEELAAYRHKSAMVNRVLDVIDRQLPSSMKNSRNHWEIEGEHVPGAAQWVEFVAEIAKAIDDPNPAEPDGD